ncbi:MULTISPECIES: cadmium resistance transporter [Micromonospora]|uniref:Cadmium resistance transporter n=1 Tax=Micromonospora zamorensis TaxID=709883 RepID=A0ABZ1PIU9_9ACTN|nr:MULTISPECIES: cadmium resistance transporter [Micromonospora]MBQ0978958.1 cadmium resistance transporter [Micromonospora sp. M61]MBQ1039591.1 cadmium resistance transporter [Micromonospora sp. C81]WTE87368.1 cadmium resistance transporter [Micromonospora zamorensis]WTI22133.1 cadmium resistance transporter [Micromonospora zamorensis]
MIDLLSTAGGAAVVFAATDIDDIVILTLFFVAARTTGRPRPWQIVAGQYLGIGALALASAVVAAGLLVVPDPWTGLLGLLPIALGVRALRASDDDVTPAVVTGTLGVAGVTIANGADNVAVYVPVFRALGAADSAVFLLVFVLLIALWCAAGAWLGGHPRVVRLVERAGHWLVPTIFIGIGVLILVSSGVLGRLVDLLG